MKSPLLHLASQIFNTPLLIQREKLEAILHAVGPRLTFDRAALSHFLNSDAVVTHPEERKSALPIVSYWDDEDESDDGYSNRKSDRKPYKMTDQGVAVIPIRGVLMKKGTWLSALCGFSSYTGLRSSIDAAMADASVRALLFDVDSPGGSTHGCFELADYLYSLRGKKPMYGVANDLAASAAYALISCCDQVFVTRTGAVGSVGVFCLHCDISSQDEKLGEKYTYIFYGEKKVDGNEHSPLSKSARADMQAEVDREGEMFVSCVSRNRAISREKVIDTKAGCFFGEESSPFFADKVGTYDDCLAALTTKLSSKGVTISASSEGDSTMDIAALKAEAEKATADYNAALKAEADKFEAEASARGYVPSRLRSAASVPINRAEDPTPDNKEKKGKAGMPNGDEDDKNCDDAKGKSAKTALAPASLPTPPSASDVHDPSAIAELCAVAGRTDLIAGYLKEKKSLSAVITDLNKIRFEKSSSSSLIPSFGTATAEGLESVFQVADTLMANSGGKMKRSDAILQAVRMNPKAYRQYEDERETAALTRSGVESYVYAVAPKLASFGLSTASGASYVSRPMA